MASPARRQEKRAGTSGHRKSLFLGGTVLFVLAAGLALGLAILLWPQVASGYDNPHGPYDAFPAGCAACHITHAGVGPGILSQPNMTAVCFTCHDGTGSIYDVVTGQFGAGSGNSVFHPVKNTGNPAVGEVIECLDCHDPHGDIVPGSNPPANYPRLLHSTDGTSTYNEGPAFCLGCHGATDRNFTGPDDTYWEDTLGNHVNNNSPAHYNSANTKLQPASGTKVTCVKCHDKHAAPSSRLLPATEESLCQGCHLDGNKAAHLTTRFNLTGSVHNVDGAGGSKLECSSCHGPHTVSDVATVGCSQCHYPNAGDRNAYKVQGSTSVLADPDNTKAAFAGAAGTGLGGTANTVGDLSDFCLKCHDGNPPTAVANTTTLVPYTIQFPATGFTSNSGGWNKSGYKSNGHATSSMAVKCGECHESHGSDYAALQKFPEDTAITSGECLRCHDGSQTGNGAKNVKTDLTKAYRHPTLDFSGTHSNTENYGNMPLADRHAECADCHDPHQNTGATASAPARSGAIAGVSGVSVNYGTSSWSNWPGDATFTLKLGVDYQYELCFKCHSYYSYGTSPPHSPSSGSPGFNETDQAKEFNPNNPAYHAVMGLSQMPSGYGKFVSPWAYDSRMYCTDCHGSDSTSVEGPHGSSQQYILKAPWNPDTSQAGATGNRGTDTSSHLCFKCHGYDFYAGSGTGATSKFSGGGGGGGGSSNLHALYKQSSYVHQQGCASCHGAVPHGYSRRGMLVTTGDDVPSPYKTGVKITGISAELPAVGNWRKWDCTTVSGCH